MRETPRWTDPTTGPTIAAVIAAVLVATAAGGALAGHGGGTPDDAIPGHTPAHTEHGVAYWNITGHSQLSVDAGFFGGAGACPTTFIVGLPAGDQCVDTYNLTLDGTETLVEVRLSWESDLTDLNLLLRDAQGEIVNNSVHGQVFINEVCEAPLNPFGECLFTFTPNGTTQEYLSADASQLAAGDWSIEVLDANNWRPEHVTDAATGGDGVPYTLEVWVSTLPGAEPTHDPFA